MPWKVYIIQCKDSKLYTGITNDIERRIKQHNSGNGCRFTKYRYPVELMYTERAVSRAEALKREARIKSFPRIDKLALINKKGRLKMKKAVIVFMLGLVLSCLNIYPAFSESASEKNVTLQNDGKYITTAEADTNNDGKSDIIVHAKDGVFQSAEVDTDYNGTMDKTFTDSSAFNQYINDTHPAYSNIFVREIGGWTVVGASF